MGTRQEGGGIGSSRPPAEVRQEYDEFTLISEWKEAEQSRLLIIYVPGFAKEQLKVSTEGTNTLRIRGERQIEISSNKKSRFQKDFRIPEDCNIKGIHARLTGGILTVTFPYKTTQLPPPPKELEAQKTTQQSPPRPPRRSQKDIRDQPSAGRLLMPPPKEDQITPTTTITTPKATSNSSRGGQTQPPDGSFENERRGEESADDQRQKGKEIVKKEEERGGTATTTAGGEEADGGWFKIEKYKKVLAAVKRFAQTHLDLNNRELLANMGVAALITLAFGAYIYYALNSSLNSSEES